MSYLPGVRPVVVVLHLLVPASFFAGVEAGEPVVYRHPFFQSPVRGEPDDLLIVAGHGLEAGARVAYVRMHDTTQPLPAPTTLPASSDEERGLAEVVSEAALHDALVVRLPFSMRPGATYALRVRNPGGEWSAPLPINDARPLWFTPATVYETARTAALPRELKVVGRNLQPVPEASTRVRLTGPVTYEAVAVNDQDATTAIEHYAARIPLPDRLPPGTYEIELTRDGRSWVSAAGSAQLSVLPDPVAGPVFDPANPLYGGCAADDGLDDAACIQAAADAAFAAGGGRVMLGAGRWELSLVPDTTWPGGLSHGIVLRPGVDLIGSGAAAGGTRIVRTAAWGSVPGICDDDPCLRAVFTVLGRNTVRDIHFDDEYPDASYRIWTFQLGKLPWVNGPDDPRRIEDVSFVSNTFTRMHTGIFTGGYPVARLFITGNTFEVYQNAILLSGNSNLKDIAFEVDDAVIADNDFYPGRYYDPAIGQGTIASQIGAARRLDFSRNVAHPQDIDGSCVSHPSGCGWRAGHFFHMNTSHEMVLVSQNALACTGDKAGDGEAIIWDNNGNTPAFPKERAVVSASPGTVEVAGPWIEDVQAFPEFYKRYWVQVVEGTGVGQTRRIAGYTDGPQITIDVAPPWDVTPDTTSRVSVLRQFWQTHIVDNLVDIRGCEKDNPTAPRAGRVGFYAMTADSAIEGNRMYESDGITLAAVYSVAEEGWHAQEMFQYFNEVRGNTVDGEYNFNDCLMTPCPRICCNSACCPPDGQDCRTLESCDSAACCSEQACCGPATSWAGIDLGYGQYPVRDSPVLGYGVSVSHNTVRAADALRGGAISIDRGWHPPPTPGHPQYRSTLIHHNALSDLRREDANGECLPYSIYGLDGGIGIHIMEPYSHDVVLYANEFADVCYPTVDSGTDSTVVPAPGAGVVAPTLALALEEDGQVRFDWSATGCSGTAGYSIYEGSIGDWSSHGPLLCAAGTTGSEETTPVSAGSSYYLVVPHNPYAEGSYGAAWDVASGTSTERPAAATHACRPTQNSSCP